MESLKNGNSFGPTVYSITELTEKIKDHLEERFDFVWVEGEISNFRSPISGHFYMTLKDERAQIRAVMFRTQARYLKFRPEDGMKVVAQGRISVYAPRGEYQLVLDYLEPLGIGALAMAFEQMKRKLSEQGLFDEDVKRPLPILPKKVAVITSPTGAAIKDFLKIINRRFANLEIVIIPVKVQGDGAAEQIIRAIEIANRQLTIDVIVITRGGGSLEDLWAFNNEELAHAIRRSAVPVVSAVGHEIDVTICDLAADLRAPTPSAAAEMLVLEKEAIIKRIEELERRLVLLVKDHIASDKDRLVRLVNHLRDPRKGLSELWLKLDDMYGRLLRSTEWLITDKAKKLKLAKAGLVHSSPVQRMGTYRQNIAYAVGSMGKSIFSEIRHKRVVSEALKRRLMDLNPMAILQRGYSIARLLPSGKILKKSSDAKAGDKVKIVLAKGELSCEVEETS